MEIVELKNRTGREIEFTHNAIVYVVPRRDSISLPRAVAEHGVKKSIFKLDPFNNVFSCKLVVMGEGYDESDLEEGSEEAVELLDREAMGDNHAKTLEFGNPDAPKGSGKRAGHKKFVDPSIVHTS